MPRSADHRWRRRLIAIAVAIAVVVVIGKLIGRGAVPDGPVAVAWNRQPCAHCRMLVGDPAYAAELIATDGTVEFFDDPGCLMRYLAERSGADAGPLGHRSGGSGSAVAGRKPAIHRLWFHDHAGDRWLAGDAAGFVAGFDTPMGYGLAAVPRGTPGAIDLAAATARIGGAP